MSKLVILVDMDGVITNFNAKLVENYVARHPGEPYVKQEDAVNWNIADDYARLISPEAAKEIDDIYHEQGFYASLAPMPGAAIALKEMLSMGHDVFICTSPLSKSEHCAAEKYKWVLEHLGRDWIARVIITRDKTLVRGDFLIDDKPKVTGLMKPVWKQILFHQPYNATTALDRITVWEEWKQVIERQQ